jgi:hypothetical protein
MKRSATSMFSTFYTILAVVFLLFLAGCGGGAEGSPGGTVNAKGVDVTPIATSPPDFSAFVGTWASHATVLVFQKNGHAQFQARTYQWCTQVPPPCDSFQGNTIVPGINEEMIFSRVVDSTAYGSMTASTLGHVGNAVWIAREPNETVNFADNLGVIRALCGPDAPGTICGA